MTTNSLELLVGQVYKSDFEDTPCGMGLLASQLRDSFFITQVDEAGPCLALVNVSNSPGPLISEEVPEIPSSAKGDEESYVLTILASDDSSKETQRLLQSIWEKIIQESSDLLGGVFTLEGFSKPSNTQALFQVIKTTSGWEQYRIHPFERDTDGKPTPIATPLVEDNESGPINLRELFKNKDK